jgi:hypothetical protein
MGMKPKSIEQKYDFNQRYGCRYDYKTSVGEFTNFILPKIKPVKIQSFKLHGLAIQPIQSMKMPLIFQHYTKSPRVPVELNPDLLDIPVESNHTWRRFHREPRLDLFQCKKCGAMASCITGIRPHPKSHPDCASAVISQVMAT